MIKLIIHCADIHIRNNDRREEYEEQLTKFINKCKEVASPYDKSEIRIVIAGDLVHSKNNVSNELFPFLRSLIFSLQEIGKVIVISGNHDMQTSNTMRMDTLTALFETARPNNADFVDLHLGYESGVLIDENVTWVLYSIFNDFRKPDVSDAKEQNPNNTVIGLFHGTVIGSQLNNGIINQDGTDGSVFNECNFVLAGHIHKKQDIKCGNTIVSYPGSLIQQNYGETVTQHGFNVWDLEEKSHTFIELNSDYSMYDFEISSKEDINSDKEILMNY